MKRLIADLERWKSEAEKELLTPWQLTERAQKALSLARPDQEPIPAEVVHASLLRCVPLHVLHDGVLIALVKARYTDTVQPKLVLDACVHLGKNTRYSNEHLGAYAAELRDRLLGDKP